MFTCGFCRKSDYFWVVYNFMPIKTQLNSHPLSSALWFRFLNLPILLLLLACEGFAINESTAVTFALHFQIFSYLTPAIVSQTVSTFAVVDCRCFLCHIHFIDWAEEIFRTLELLRISSCGLCFRLPVQSCTFSHFSSAVRLSELL
ncbi:PREDICTED: uncharacterized protein LOC105137902 [Populus euphratica]|uniref:Uncharacterized protein LOC105137902 n=1 Tax=Populus euphratica TaxID=75702 RepID=A0AAJ6V6E3_POPEU|nr:PREDICTED: uncharacterized protein LOC105137902 [Populus euphratica]